MPEIVIQELPSTKIRIIKTCNKKNHNNRHIARALEITKLYA